jgi:outer membrane immunogenic protein
MKFLSSGIAALALLLPMATTAYAANLPVKAPPSPLSAATPVAPADWTGFYLGINGSDGLVGGTLGYNYQTGMYVLGVEGDIDTTWSSSSSPPYLGTARARVGLAFDQIMPYLTGGLAFDHGNTGTVVGGGVEFRITSALSLKAEYLHFEINNYDDMVRLGLNWRFNMPMMPTAVVTRY